MHRGGYDVESHWAGCWPYCLSASFVTCRVTLMTNIKEAVHPMLSAKMRSANAQRMRTEQKRTLDEEVGSVCSLSPLTFEFLGSHYL